MAKIMVNSQAPIPNIHLTSPVSLTSSLKRKSGDGKPGLSLRLIDAQRLACRLLQEVGIESALLDAQILLGHILNMDRIEMVLSGSKELSVQEWESFFAAVTRRLCREPIAYIVGYKEFFSLTFMVNQDCLIPRPDTEIVVEKCLSLLDEDEASLIFDVCTGSGAIACALLTHRKNVRVIASDISEKALAVAQKNAVSLGVVDRFSSRLGDLFACFHGLKAMLIVANPPYISTEAMALLARDIRDFEPHGALHAGDEDGIAYYVRIIKSAAFHLDDGGFLVLEIGFDQKDKIKSLINPHLELVEFFVDLAGNTRGVVLKKV